MRSPCAVLLWLSCSLIAQVTVQSPHVFESEHYRLHSWLGNEVSADFLLLAEGMYEQLQEHFGKAPLAGTKLEAKFWPDQAGYLSGLKADAVPEAYLNGASFFFHSNWRVYIWSQPTAAYTRRQFVWQMANQFLWRTIADPERCPSWYLSGMAEEFSCHRWDGRVFQYGVHDLIDLTEPFAALENQARSGVFDLAAVVEGRRAEDPMSSFAAVDFFLRGADARSQRRFADLEKQFVRGKIAKDYAETLLGRDRKALCKAAGVYVRSLRTTWQVVYNNWDSLGADPVGDSPVVTVLRTKVAPKMGGAFVAATLDATAGSAGLVLGFRNHDDYLIVWRRPNQQIELVQRLNGSWRSIANAQGEGEVLLRLRAELSSDGTVTVKSGAHVLLQKQVESVAIDGFVGLAVEAGKCRFRDVVVPDNGS